MGKKNARYCIRANPPNGWQIWDRKRQKWWGRPHKDYSEAEAVLAKLNSGNKSDLKY